MRKTVVDHAVTVKLSGPKTPLMFPRYNTVEVDDAKLAYRRLEKLLSQEQAQNATQAKMCSPGAPQLQKERNIKM
jgi:hypothetical protein